MHNGQSSLHHTVAQNFEITQLLIERGVRIIVTDRAGRIARDLLSNQTLQLRFTAIIEAFRAQDNVEEQAVPDDIAEEVQLIVINDADNIDNAEVME